MKIIYVFLLLSTFIFASYVENPHEIDIVNKNIHDDVCRNCHVSFMGEYSGYFASLYTPSIDDYATYLAYRNVSIEDIETAGSNLESSDSFDTDPLFTSSSKLCMGCHDGVIALAVGHKDTLRINLEDSHPISVDYIEGKSGLRDKNTQIINWNNASSIKDILVNDKIECISCHSPHNKTYTNYLRSKNNGSKLCMTCHNR